MTEVDYPARTLHYAHQLAHLRAENGRLRAALDHQIEDAELVPDAGDWAEAVRQVRSYYPEDVFPAFSTSTDAKSGTFARHLCDLIEQTAYGHMIDRRAEYNDGPGVRCPDCGRVQPPGHHCHRCGAVLPALSDGSGDA